MKLSQRFDYHIREAIVAELQTNPYKIASSITNKPHDDPETIAFATKEGGMVETWNKNLRNMAYIFGDTYIGMNIVETIKILISEGFNPVAVQNGHIFEHELLGIVATPRCNESSELIGLTLDLALKIKIDRINADSMCGLGIKNPNVIGNILYTKIDATGGLKAKMFVLRSLADITTNTPS